MKFKDVFVFDLGAVLIDWNPEYHYLKFATKEEYKDFLQFITPFNHLWDIGVSSRLLKNTLLVNYPERERFIRPWFESWDEFLQAPMPDTVNILRKLHEKGYELYSITNWSRENFPEAKGEYDFLRLFSDVVISGCVGLIKPDKRIFQMLLDRNNLEAEHCIFIDDRADNVEVAKSVGYRGIHFKGAKELHESLKSMGITL